MSAYNPWPGGSIWRKWDLHVHTPLSIVQEFGGDKPESWERYISDLESLPEEYKVLGINDYIFVDGYERLQKEKKENGRLKNVDLLLPVLEFRLRIFGGNKKLNRVNFHVIFSDEVRPEVIRRHFLDKLKVEYSGWNQGIRSPDDLEAFGELCIQQIPTDKRGELSAKKDGFNNLTYDFEDIFEVLNNDQHFVRNGIPLYLTAIGRSEWDDMRWESAGADKRKIINSCDFVFVASKDIQQYQSSRAKLTQEEVNNRLFHFSDAHHYSDADRRGMKIGDSFTWIKGNPTFEGLRQTRFEFEERVKISSNKPFTRNEGTILKKIFFHSPSQRFSDEPIYLNPFLNVIIGGYSMGKSMLLHHLGKGIDSKELIEKGKVLPSKTGDPEFLLKKYDFVKEELDSEFAATLEWVDGERDFIYGSGTTSGRKIMYFPQGYIETLATPGFYKSKKNLDDYITELIRQNPAIDSAYEKFLDLVRDYEKRMPNLIDDLYRASRELKDAEKKLRDYGDLAGIKNLIENLKEELVKTKENSGLSGDEQKSYDLAVKEISSLESRKNKLETDERNLSQFFREELHLAKKLQDQYTSLQAEIGDNLVLRKIQEELAFLESISEQLLASNKAMLDLEEGFIPKEVSSTNDLLTENTSVRDPLAAKLPDEQQLKAKEEKILQEEKKLQDHSHQSKLRDNLFEKSRKAKVEIVELYDKTFAAYEDICNRLNEFLVSTTEELELKAEIGYYYRRLDKDFEPMVNKKSFRKTTKGNMSLSDLVKRAELSDFDSHKGIVLAFLDDLIADQLPLNGQRGFNEALKVLLRDSFYINWEIIYDGDQLEYMSPGKASLVILKLIIEMSNDEWPILIDQPEDHLDNRSIYKDLVHFLKKKKNHRQIIIVTHNPNLLIGADAENVIVANRTGRGRGNYNFEYVSGAIEHTFPIKVGDGIESKGIREHICEILEGGEEAFRKREGRYGFKAAGD